MYYSVTKSTLRTLCLHLTENEIWLSYVPCGNCRIIARSAEIVMQASVAILLYALKYITHGASIYRRAQSGADTCQCCLSLTVGPKCWNWSLQFGS
jgi:hypothetical protein